MKEENFNLDELKGIGDLDFGSDENMDEETEDNVGYNIGTETIFNKEISEDSNEGLKDSLMLQSLNELDEEPDTLDNYSNDEEIMNLQNTIVGLKDELGTNENKFSRTENKFDFASEVINALENQKTANLDTGEIDDLIKKRKFTNICKQFGWNVMANIMNSVVTDIESYSLSKEALLVKLITTDLSRNISVSEQNIRKVKGGRKTKDEIVI